MVSLEGERQGPHAIGREAVKVGTTFSECSSCVCVTARGSDVQSRLALVLALVRAARTTGHSDIHRGPAAFNKDYGCFRVALEGRQVQGVAARVSRVRWRQERRRIRAGTGLAQQGEGGGVTIAGGRT